MAVERNQEPTAGRLYGWSFEAKVMRPVRRRDPCSHLGCSACGSYPFLSAHRSCKSQSSVTLPAPWRLSLLLGPCVRVWAQFDRSKTWFLNRACCDKTLRPLTMRLFDSSPPGEYWTSRACSCTTGIGCAIVFETGAADNFGGGRIVPTSVQCGAEQYRTRMVEA